ncbi:MAG: hypothetical protein IKY66_03465 [Bacteroidales bacterium]|nr:hypothetical protein [Bacteroidales bacterium]
MIKELKYGGLTASPLDYECNDGDMAISMDLMPEDGALKPVLPPKRVLSIPATYSLLYVHEGNGYKNYIVRNSSDILALPEGYVKQEGDDYRILLLSSSVELYQINAIGNTLIILTSEGINYLLYKGSSYISLGTDFPECSLSFGLSGSKMEYSDSVQVSCAAHSPYHLVGNRTFDITEFSDDNKIKITDAVLGQVNKFIAEKATQAGRFLMPFFVRCAFRLYDGSLTMHSPPVLMMCDSGITPCCGVTSASDSKGDSLSTIYTNTAVTQFDIKIFGMIHSLDYAAGSNSFISELKKWSDIITSVDVFISAPIYRLDINGKCKSFLGPYTDLGYSICKLATGTHYGHRSNNNSNTAELLATIDLPTRSYEDYTSDIKDCSNFYFLKSIPIDKLSATRKVIDIDEGYLGSLVNREVMTDDYDSHDKLFAERSFVYNNRLNLSGIKKRIFKGYSLFSMLCYSDAPYNYVSATGRLTIEVEESGKHLCFVGDSGTIGALTPIYYLYYPSAGAKKVLFQRTYAGSVYEREVEFTPHALLNGSFYYKGGSGMSPALVTTATTKTGKDEIIEYPNKLYTSDVNNPFYFPVTGINTIGTGSILGISSAVKALSQGQFGQFPLYAFTSDGVWALEVSNTGSFTARQPVTRDVCVNPESITQIDSAVLFVTDRGIMLLAGSETTCISEVIDGALPDILSYPSGKNLVGLTGITESAFEFVEFREFLKGCRMFYDYTHQRIVVFNPSYGYAYAYSLKSKAWGMMSSQMKASANSYPETAVQLNDGSVVDYTGEGDYDNLVGFMLTRPLKLDNQDILKTVYSAIQRGKFRRDAVKVVLYGSRDLENWHCVFSSNNQYLRGFAGTPYKYYRIGVITSFTTGNSLYGCSINYENKQVNDLR